MIISALLFFAVLGGLVVFGVPGLILGPVLVAVALGLFDVIHQTGKPAEAIRHEPGLAEQTAIIAEKSEGNGIDPSQHPATKKAAAAT